MANAARRRRSVVIGVSRFGDPKLRSLPFAAADARAFAKSVRSTGSVTTLTDGEATAASVREAFGTLSRTEVDDVVIFVVSHFMKTVGDPIVATADGPISLIETLGPVWSGSAARVVLLLDPYRSAGDDRPSPWDIAALFPPRPGRTLLLADDGRFGSYVSGELQAGIWASHVAAAFSREASQARESDGTLTVGSLRAFLAEELPRSLKRAYTDARSQSPVCLAASETEQLDEPMAADGAPVTSKPPLAGVRFFTERTVPVKSLGGFRKSIHSPPADTLGSSREWVARLAEPDLAKDVEETVARLRRHLGYKRRDVRADNPAGGAATVLTPDFAYHVSARQDPGQADRALVRRTLAQVTNANLLSRSEFADAFPQGFSSLHCPFDTPADVAALIDAVEGAEPSTVARIDYPTDLSHCDLELAGFEGRVRVEREGITITAAGPVAPMELAAQFAHVRRILNATAT